MKKQKSMLLQTQTTGSCGPTCLSICMAAMGLNLPSKVLSEAIGGVASVRKNGVDEFEIQQMAEKKGVNTYFIQYFLKGDRRFTCDLYHHLYLKKPIILMTENFEHWVAVLGVRDDGQFIIRNPEHKSRRFVYWTSDQVLKRAWNEHKNADDEESQYFAIALERI